MGWTTYHHRGDVLRAVADEIELRCDGTLPTDDSTIRRSVEAAFHDSLDLVGALHFRWHHRLVACLEQQLDGRTSALDQAVTQAWADAAQSLPGLRLLLDAQLAEPADPAVGAALTRATAKEHQLLASMAGQAGRLDQGPDSHAVRIGAELELLARARPAPVRRVPSGSASFVRRLRAVLAA